MSFCSQTWDDVAVAGVGAGADSEEAGLKRTGRADVIRVLV